MKKELFKEIEIPSGVEVEIEKGTMIIKGKEGEIKRKFKTGNLNFKKEGDKVILGHKKATKKEKKTINTIAAHIKNMIMGVQEKYEYELKACFSHFPITVEIKDDEAIIKNFLGEKVPRKVKLPKGVEIEIDKTLIKIKSVDKELAGQAAANLETATKIRGRDRRVFQDGIYLINKSGRKI